MSIIDNSNAPVMDAEACVPSNDVADNLAVMARGLYVGVSGNVVAVLPHAVVLGGEKTVTFVGLAAGVIHNIPHIRINSTGTTATNILNVY